MISFKLLNLTSSFHYSPAGRAFPDISARGDNFQIIGGGQVQSATGTSASCPVSFPFSSFYN